MTHEEWNTLSMSEQAEAWERMSAEEREALFPGHGAAAAVAEDPPEEPQTEEPSSEQSVVISPQEQLAILREHSCYSALRLVINLLTWPIVVAVIFGGGLATIGAVSSEDAVMGIAALVGTVVATVLVVALNQAASLLVDIADAQIHQSAKSREGQ